MSLPTHPFDLKPVLDCSGVVVPNLLAALKAACSFSFAGCCLSGYSSLITHTHTHDLNYTVVISVVSASLSLRSSLLCDGGTVDNEGVLVHVSVAEALDAFHNAVPTVAARK